MGRFAPDRFKALQGMGMLLALWTLSATALAGAPNYDAFSEADGYIATKQQEFAAWEMLRDPEQVEAVYADAVKGNVRAVRVLQQLEATLAASGAEVAERTSRPACLVPAYKELSGTCRPDWSSLDFLSKDKSGGVRLREVIFGAFAARARQRGLENQAILAAANGLLSIAFARGVLLEAEAGARPMASPVPAAAERAAEGAGRGGTRLKPEPAAEGLHTTFKRDPQTGRVTNYETYQPQTNPRDPKPWESLKRYDGNHPHFDKETGKRLQPHVHDPSAPSGVRPPDPSEIPK